MANSITSHRRSSFSLRDRQPRIKTFAGLAGVPGSHGARRQSLGLLLALAPLLASGCAERLLKIRSDPPGAEVFLNGQPVLTRADGESRRATTPVDVPFDFYGTYHVVLRAPGHDSRSRLVTIPAPFYQYPPLDLVVEYLVPWPIRDHHELHFELVKTPPLDDTEGGAYDDLVKRMETLRLRAEEEE